MSLSISPFTGKVNRFYQSEFHLRVFFTFLNPTCEPTRDRMEFAENSLPYTCRDLLCSALLHSKFFDKLKAAKYESYLSAPIDTDHGLFLAVGVESFDQEHLITLPSRIKVLHDIEIMMGLNMTEITTVSSDDFSNDYQEFPSDPLRQILKLDPRWATNTISFSLVTGIIRALVVNEKFTEYNLRTLLCSFYDGSFKNHIEYDDDIIDDEDEVRMEEALGLFIRNWQELHAGVNGTVFGIDMSKHTLEIYDGGFSYSTPNRKSVIYPLSKGSLGIIWFLNVVAMDYTADTFINMANVLKGALEDEVNSR